MANLFFGGGLNEHGDELNISDEECVEGQNFILDAHKRNYRPRPPFDLKGTATNGSEVSGILQLIKRDDSDTLLVTAGTQVYSVDDSFVFSDVGDIVSSNGLLASYWSLDDELLITDISKNNVIHSWDGTTFEPHQHGIGTGTVKTSTGVTQLSTTVTITISAHGYSNNDLVTVSELSPTGANGEFVISGVTANTFNYTSASSTTATGTANVEQSIDLHAKYSVVWKNRMWLFNVTTNGTENPHMMLASQFEEANVFDTTQQVLPYTTGGLTGNEAFFLLSPDMRPINGAAVFFDTLIISTVNGQLYKMTGNDSTDFQVVPYYPGSAAIGDRTMINTGNDLMWMTRGAEIERLSTVEAAGDVKADNVSNFISTTMSGLSDGIAAYDEYRQLIYWFVTDKVLVLDKDFLFTRPGISPWSVYETEHDSRFNTNAVSYIRDPGANTYDVYFGDAEGRIMKLNGTRGGGDAGSAAVITSRKSKHIVLPDEFTELIGRIEYRRITETDIDIHLDWVIYDYKSSNRITLAAPLQAGSPLFWGQANNFWGQDIYWNQGRVTTPLSNRGFSPTGKGNGVFITVEHNGTADFLINRLMINE